FDHGSPRSCSNLFTWCLNVAQRVFEHPIILGIQGPFRLAQLFQFRPSLLQDFQTKRLKHLDGSHIEINHASTYTLALGAFDPEQRSLGDDLSRELEQHHRSPFRLETGTAISELPSRS